MTTEQIENAFKKATDLVVNMTCKLPVEYADSHLLGLVFQYLVECEKSSESDREI